MKKTTFLEFISLGRIQKPATVQDWQACKPVCKPHAQVCKAKTYMLPIEPKEQTNDWLSLLGVYCDLWDVLVVSDVSDVSDLSAKPIQVLRGL